MKPEERNLPINRQLRKAVPDLKNPFDMRIWLVANRALLGQIKTLEISCLSDRDETLYIPKELFELRNLKSVALFGRYTFGEEQPSYEMVKKQYQEAVRKAAAENT